MIICDKDLCTACGACVNTCPRQCISWQKDELDTILPVVDDDNCVNCGACLHVCHINKDMGYHTPIKCYAAWALDPETRRTSASGGITSVFYQYTLKRSGFTCGVELDLKNGAHFIPVLDENDIMRVKNSKYVYSHTDGIFKQVKDNIKTGRFVFFVGLPCQVAALKSFLGKLYENDNLLTADILCHGVVNEDYLFQYLHYIERLKKKKAVNLSFRDPNDGTESFVFTLHSKNEKAPFYKQNHYGTNLYYIGYMDELQYRENCYHCHYARTERISDLTFGDFDGLGREIPFDYWNRQVSLCLVNNKRGEKYLEEVQSLLFLEERPLSEAVEPQKQLNKPADGHPNRDLFIEEYRRTHDFTISSKKALKKELLHNKTVKLRKEILERPLKHILPKNIVELLKKLRGIK